MRDPASQTEFLRQGFVKVSLLSAAEVGHLLGRLAQLTPDDNFAPDSPFTTYHCSFLDTNREYRRQTHALVNSVFAPQVDRLLAGYRLLNANFYVKPPGTGEFTVHQNWPAITDLSDTTVTVWCPLTDVAESNGAIQVVEGSQKIIRHVEAPHSPPYFADFADSLIRSYLKPIPMAAGEAIIFDDSLIHWSARNDSAHPRVAIQALCIPVDATPAFYCKAGDTHFELIDADSEFFLSNDAEDLYSRQPRWTSLGFVDNPNRPISERQFADLMAKRGEPRRRWFGRSRSSRG